jgi:ketosteroid isomerase-like protein
MANPLEVELLEVVHAWDRAMVTNDPLQIGRYMAEDWVIIGPDGSIGNKATFLTLVGSGKLTHDVMESHEVQIRLYGFTGLVISRGISGGKYDGTAFYLVERVSCVFVKRQEWECVSTHLSQLGQPPG